jgi:hypothetical protein
MHNTIFQIRQLLVDASASMEFYRKEMLDAIADHLGDYQRFVASHPETSHKVGLAFFNTKLSSAFFMLDPGQIPEIGDGDYQPQGDTHLFDAISAKIDQIEDALRATGDYDHAIIDLHLLSDGVDTGSETVRFADLRARMDQLKASGRWHFHFSLADLDAIELNALLGLRRRLAEKTSAAELRLALVDFLTPNDESGQSHKNIPSADDVSVKKL